jgi:glutathione S-transferase
MTLDPTGRTLRLADVTKIVGMRQLFRSWIISASHRAGLGRFPVTPPLQDPSKPGEVRASMRLYDFADSFNALRARVVAFESGLEPDITPVNLVLGEQRKPAFLAKNPLGRVPVLEDGDFVLTESFAIAAHLAAGGPLMTGDSVSRANVERWQFFSAAHLTPAVTKVYRQRVVHPMVGAHTDDAIVETGLRELSECLPVLEGALRGRDWLVGALSVADFSELGDYPAIRGWLGRLAVRESWKRALHGCRVLAA